MESKSENAFRTILPGYLVRDDVQMTHAVRLVPLCMNSQLHPSGTQYPIVMNRALLACIKSNESAVGKAPHPLMIY